MKINHTVWLHSTIYSSWLPVLCALSEISQALIFSRFKFCRLNRMFPAHDKFSIHNICQLDLSISYYIFEGQQNHRFMLNHATIVSCTYFEKELEESSFHASNAFLFWIENRLNEWSSIHRSEVCVLSQGKTPLRPAQILRISSLILFGTEVCAGKYSNERGNEIIIFRFAVPTWITDWCSSGHWDAWNSNK